MRVATRQALSALLDTSPHFSVTLVWCPAHVGIQENEEVDEAAKDATTTGELLSLPTSLAALRQRINAACKRTVTQPPSREVIQRLRGAHEPLTIRKALQSLPRPEATAIAQLRANHTPLSHFLCRIGAVEAPTCAECNQPETTEHYVLLCRAYTPARITMLHALRELQVPRTLQDILTTPRAFHPLADYIKETKRFARARQKQPAHNHNHTHTQTQTNDPIPNSTAPRSQPPEPPDPT